MNGELRRKEKLGSCVEVPRLCLFSPQLLPAVLRHDLASERDTGLEPVKSSLEGWRRTRRLIPQETRYKAAGQSPLTNDLSRLRGATPNPPAPAFGPTCTEGWRVRGGRENRTPGARRHGRFPSGCGKPTSRVTSMRGQDEQRDSTQSVLQQRDLSGAARGSRTLTPCLASTESYRWTMAAKENLATSIRSPSSPPTRQLETLGGAGGS